MRQELLMPKLGLTMTEGTVAEWVVSPGTAFRTGDTLLLIETDKVVIECPAECDGVLIETIVQTGELIDVGKVIGYIEVSGSDAATTPAVSVPPTSQKEARIVSTPLARRVAANLAVDLRQVTGSGPRGRVRADDVRAAAARNEEKRQEHAAPRAEVPAPSAAPVDGVQGTFVKPTSIQATMARRLTAAKQQIPHFYLAAEAEVSRLLAARSEINASKPTVKLTLNHFVIAAVARALRDLPACNQVWTDSGIQVFDRVDVGVAVSSERGLLVPVVRDIGGASLSEIATRSSGVVDRARQGALTPADVGGGAITVSNAGMHEVTWMTPIINPGTAMILGVGSIRDVFRPDTEGRPVLRREMGLVLAADHRLVDGVDGLELLNRVIGYMRNPLALL